MFDPGLERNSIAALDWWRSWRQFCGFFHRFVYIAAFEVAVYSNFMYDSIGIGRLYASCSPGPGCLVFAWYVPVDLPVDRR